MKNRETSTFDDDGIAKIGSENLRSYENLEIDDKTQMEDKGILAKIGHGSSKPALEWMKDEDGSTLSRVETEHRMILMRLKSFFEALKPGTVNMVKVENIRIGLDLEHESDKELYHRLLDPITEQWTDERVWKIESNYYRAIYKEFERRQNSAKLAKLLSQNNEK